jgi:acyl-CoA thioesterase-1
MRIPRNLGTEYVERFRQVFPTVADQYAPVTLVQFDERLQAGADSLIQDDGIHPTAAGHRLVARDVWTKLRPLLEEMRAETPA